MKVGMGKWIYDYGSFDYGKLNSFQDKIEHDY